METTGFYLINGKENLKPPGGLPWRVRVQKPKKELCTYFDTFDGAFAKKSLVLAHKKTPNASLWELLDEGGFALVTTPGNQARFAWDFPPDAWRERVESISGERALLPLFKSSATSTTWEFLDKEDKTLFRVTLSSPEFSLPAARNVKKVGRVLHLAPLKGYEDEAQKALETLRGHFDLAPLGQSLYSKARELLAIAPAKYSSKVNAKLTPDMPAVEAVKTILTRLLEVMDTNEAGMVADVDSEFLHDFRVSVRRTRSLFGRLKDALPQAFLQRYNAEFNRLGKLTNSTRDLDVYIVKVREHLTQTDAETAKALTPFLRFLEKLQKREQKILAQKIAAKSYQQFKARYLAALQKLKLNKDFEGETAQGISDRRIWKLFKKARKEGSRIHLESPPELLHALRITCKKLRYMIEFFGSLKPPEEMARLVSALKALQDNLGEINDLAVQSGALKTFGREMAKTEPTEPDTLIELGRFMEALHQRQIEARLEFAQKFAEFTSPENMRLVSALYNPDHEERGE